MKTHKQLFMQAMNGPPGDFMDHFDFGLPFDDAGRDNLSSCLNEFFKVFGGDYAKVNFELQEHGSIITSQVYHAPICVEIPYDESDVITIEQEIKQAYAMDISCFTERLIDITQIRRNSLWKLSCYDVEDYEYIGRFDTMLMYELYKLIPWTVMVHKQLLEE